MGVKIMSEFFNMGGYGYHVWGIMLLALVIMLAEPLSLKLQRKTLLLRIQRNKRIRRNKD
ncbi:MAG TPA: heme exporter protein CcmD [Leucothrix mucor]|uniref:Heme exporter protein CcmD n=1 Tax=Leucothrix mucor TaxID=45248 RepID=A0A7V2WUA0_LEUMU|nr:heme exporter protein CcmD [Leucothrix mucor]